MFPPLFGFVKEKRIDRDKMGRERKERENRERKLLVSNFNEFHQLLLLQIGTGVLCFLPFFFVLKNKKEGKEKRGERKRRERERRRREEGEKMYLLAISISSTNCSFFKLVLGCCASSSSFCALLICCMGGCFSPMQ